MKRTWWGCLLVLLALGGGRAGAAERPYVIKVGPALVYLDVGVQQGAAVGDIYAVVRPDEAQDALVGLVTIIRAEQQFCIAEIGYRAEGEQFEILQRAMPLKEWEAAQQEAPPPEPEHHPEAEGHAEHGGRWALHLTGGMGEKHSERTLGLALGLELSERVGLDLGFKLAGELPSERSQYIGELTAKYFPLGSAGARPYLGGGVSLRQLSHGEQTALKWGGQALAGLAVPLGGWHLMAEGGYQRVAEWSGVVDVSGWLGQLAVGVHF